MAHFAKINTNNIVESVFVISNADITDENGVESETIGIALCKEIFGPGTYAQTSYHGRFNGEFATPGSIYSPVHNTFRSPQKPFPSWFLGPNDTWIAPKPKPETAFLVDWKEDLQDWKIFTSTKFVNGVELKWNEIDLYWQSWDSVNQTFVRWPYDEPAPPLE